MDPSDAIDLEDQGVIARESGRRVIGRVHPVEDRMNECVEAEDSRLHAW